MKLEDFKLQKGDRLDTLSKKYISVTKGGNRRELYSIISGSYICTEYFKPKNDKNGGSSNRGKKRELVCEEENYLIYKYNKTYYIYSLITNSLEAKCDTYYKLNIKMRKIEIFNMLGRNVKNIDLGKKGDSEFSKLNIVIGNFNLNVGISTLIYYDSVVIVQDYYSGECYMKDGTFVGNVDQVAENTPFIITEKMVALLNNNKWRIYDITDGRDKYHLEFNLVKILNNCIVAYAGGRYLDTNRNKIIIFNLNGEEIHTITNVYDFDWQTCTGSKSSVIEIEAEKKVYFFDTVNLKKYMLNGKVKGEVVVSGLKEKWYYLVCNETANKIGLIELSEKKGFKKIMPIKYKSIYCFDDFLYGERDGSKDIYDLTGRFITTVNKNNDLTGRFITTVNKNND